MAFDRHDYGLATIRILIGMFFIFEGLGKLRWLIDSSMLSQQLANWAATAGPRAGWYLEHVARPYAAVFARLVVLGELGGGIALVLGVATPIVAALLCVMVLNFHFASGALVKFSAGSNPYVFPVTGALLGLIIGGRRLPWSLR
jgi:uncharacterized membrane protein YphA (DoxX/SURF4 family)